jgi:hypothetical protein
MTLILYKNCIQKTDDNLLKIFEFITSNISIGSSIVVCDKYEIYKQNIVIFHTFYLQYINKASSYIIVADKKDAQVLVDLGFTKDNIILLSEDEGGDKLKDYRTVSVKQEDENFIKSIQEIINE